MPHLTLKIRDLEFRNPILSASGTYGHGLEMQYMSAPSRLGGLVSKSVSLRPRAGNPGPRIRETEAGFLNSIGLENRGAEYYLEQVLPEAAAAETNIVTNIVGEGTADEYAELAALLDEQEGIDALEVNLSCPNVQGGKLPFATDPVAAEEVISRVPCGHGQALVRQALSQRDTYRRQSARAVEAGGADAVTAVNTLLGMQLDWRTGRPGLGTVVGGFSGPAIKPVALRCAWECSQAVAIPVIGCGGIASAEDVLEFMVAGCTLVQIGTASFADPSLPERISTELPKLLEEASISDIRELIGAVSYP